MTGLLALAITGSVFCLVFAVLAYFADRAPVGPQDLSWLDRADGLDAAGDNHSTEGRWPYDWRTDGL